MKKSLLMKTMLLLCALMVGSMNGWADVVTFDATKDVAENAASYQTTEKTYTATDGSTWKANGYGSTANTSLVIGKGGANYLLTPNVSGNISSVAVTWSGNASYYLALQTTDGTELEAKSNSSSSTTKTFLVTGSYSQLKLVGRRASGTSNAAATITKVVVTYTPGGGPTTYSVFYDGNGATSGTAPTDANAYSSGDEVTVLGNTGSLEKSSFAFVGWNTKNDGTGTDYSAGDKFNITANTSLYAKWNFVVTDGIFDFENAGAQEPLEDYGSGVPLSSSPYVTENKTWKAGNVTMVTSGKYRWWSADKTLRIYSNDPDSYLKISVPDDYVVTKVVFSGGSAFTPSTGTLTSGTWRGSAQEVTFTYVAASGSTNVKKITVTYMKENQTETVQPYGWASYVTPAAVEFSANTAYVVTDASVSTGLTLEAVTQVPERTPVLLKGAGTKDITVIASATAPATNLLSVSSGTIPDGKYAYVLAKNGAGACFKQWTGTASTLKGRVVLILDEAVATARAMFNLDDDVTAIEAVKAKNVENGQYFNLAGQRVAQPTKGLYIVNGKKVIIK